MLDEKNIIMYENKKYLSFDVCTSTVLSFLEYVSFVLESRKLKIKQLFCLFKFLLVFVLELTLRDLS